MQEAHCSDKQEHNLNLHTFCEFFLLLLIDLSQIKKLVHSAKITFRTSSIILFFLNEFVEKLFSLVFISIVYLKIGDFTKRVAPQSGFICP